uniref:Uncharacterized protein n=1 Tax=Alexandrium monilatum TaxID=311494 RepID=A0A7S4Q3R9_9DINO
MSGGPAGSKHEAASQQPAAPRWNSLGSGASAGSLLQQDERASSQMRLHTARAGSSARMTGDGALLGMVRRQLDAFEERVLGQLAGAREQQQSGRLREVALARLETKVAAAESAQPKLDRRIAELMGNFKGLSDELQAQIRRTDQADERFCNWRRQLEEELRQRFQDVEQRVQQASSGTRVLDASTQESHKRLAQRLARIEAGVGERPSLHDEVQAGLNSVHERLAALEENGLSCQASVQEAISRSHALGAAAPRASEEALTFLEQRLAVLADRVEGVLQDAHEVHARVAAQEQQHKALRTLVEAREQHMREWDGKLGVMSQGEHVSDSQPILSARGGPVAEAAGSLQALNDCQDRLQQALNDCQDRLQQAESRMAVLEVELEGARADSGLAPQVAALVTQLREVLPRVMQHGHAIAELRASERPGEGASSEELSKIVEQLNSHSLLLSEQAEKGQLAIAEASAAKRDLERLTELSDGVRGMADGLAGDFDGLKRDIVSLAAAMPRREEILEVAGQVTKHAALLSEAAERGRRAAAESSAAREERRVLAAASDSIREAVEAVLRDFADLRSEFQENAASSKDVVERLEFQGALELLRQEIGALRPRLEASALQESVERLHKEDLQKMFDRLNEHAEMLEEHGLKTRRAMAEASEAKRNAECLAARLSADGAAGHPDSQQGPLQEATESQLSCISTEKADVSALIRALDPQLDALAQHAGASENGDVQQQQLLLAGARRVWEDQESEAKAHERVLACIDELCARLATLDSMVTAEGGHSGTDLEHRFEALSGRVAEVQALEKQLEAKVEGLTAQARLGRGPGAALSPRSPAVEPDGDAGGGGLN